ncbi:DciA family protein [Marinobacter sp.]|uniref:DciA family protein n=1 Tax=Marinobacter sp. TaxID=50741 RepID=UPI002B481D57|nr:DciA family protein [Marinobacter sp.]HKK55067.1 DciA family protein [Marinobacter sp.]
MKKKNDLQLTPDSFGRASALRQLIAKADKHAEAEQQVIAAMPDSLAQGSRFVSCNEGELIIATDTAAKATQIRFRQHDIMTAVREYELFRFVWKLKVKVRPVRHGERPYRRTTPLSNENARLLREEAGHTKDQQLREILEKLASHVRD